MCKNEYKTIFTKSKSDATLSTWYVFKNEKWEKETKKNILEKIRSTLNSLYENKIGLLVTVLNTITNDKIIYKIINEQKLTAEKILNKIKKEYFIKNIMKESNELFHSQ
jgi:DNA integrity scanning protein DisA with diadenylate cyclase activity